MNSVDDAHYEVLMESPGLTFILVLDTGDGWEIHEGPSLELIMTLAVRYAQGSSPRNLTWPDLLSADYDAHAANRVVQEVIGRLVSEDARFVLLWHLHGEDEIHVNHSKDQTERAAHDELQSALVAAFEEQFVWLESWST